MSNTTLPTPFIFQNGTIVASGFVSLLIGGVTPAPPEED
jgi:hypothetical protein